jgi:hypothetical protein
MDFGKSLPDFWVSPAFATCQIESLPRNTSEVRDSVCAGPCVQHVLPEFSIPGYSTDGSKIKRHHHSYASAAQSHPSIAAGLHLVDKHLLLSSASTKHHPGNVTKNTCLTLWSTPESTPRASFIRGFPSTSQDSPYVLGTDDLDIIEQTLQGTSEILPRCPISEFGPFDSFELIQAAEEPEPSIDDVAGKSGETPMQPNCLQSASEYSDKQGDIVRSIDSQLPRDLRDSCTGNRKVAAGHRREKDGNHTTRNIEETNRHREYGKPDLANGISLVLPTAAMDALEPMPQNYVIDDRDSSDALENRLCSLKPSECIHESPQYTFASQPQLPAAQVNFLSSNCFEAGDIDAILKVSESTVMKQTTSANASSRRGRMLKSGYMNCGNNASTECHDFMASTDILIGLYQAALSSNTEPTNSRCNEIAQTNTVGQPNITSAMLRQPGDTHIKPYGDGLTEQGFGSHTSSPTCIDESNDDRDRSVILSDQYDDLSDDIKYRIDALREKILQMPRRKLRESLADKVTLDEIEPLMAVNRDDLATMLSLGVTTWKSFVHQELGIARWPARSLKSSATKTRETRERLLMAVEEGRSEDIAALHVELERLQSDHEHIMEQLRAAARLRRTEKFKAEQAFDEAIRVFSSQEGKAGPAKKASHDAREQTLSDDENECRKRRRVQ